MDTGSSCLCDSSDIADPTEYLEKLKQKYMNRTSKLQAKQMELENKIKKMEAFIGKKDGVPKVFQETPVRDIDEPGKLVHIQPQISQPCSFFQKVMDSAKSILSVKCQCATNSTGVKPTGEITGTLTSGVSASNPTSSPTSCPCSSPSPTSDDGVSDVPTREHEKEQNVVEYDNTLTDKSSRTSLCTCDFDDATDVSVTNCSCNTSVQGIQQSQQVSIDVTSSSTKDSKQDTYTPQKSGKCLWRTAEMSDLTGKCTCGDCACDSSFVFDESVIENPPEERINVPFVSVFSNREEGPDVEVQASPPVSEKGVFHQAVLSTANKGVTCCKSPQCPVNQKIPDSPAIIDKNVNFSSGVQVNTIQQSPPTKEPIPKTVSNFGATCCSAKDCPLNEMLSSKNQTQTNSNHSAGIQVNTAGKGDEQSAVTSAAVSCCPAKNCPLNKLKSQNKRKPCKCVYNTTDSHTGPDQPLKGQEKNVQVTVRAGQSSGCQCKICKTTDSRAGPSKPVEIREQDIQVKVRADQSSGCQCAFVGSPLLSPSDFETVPSQRPVSTTGTRMTPDRTSSKKDCECDTNQDSKQINDKSEYSLNSQDIADMQNIAELAKKEKQMKAHIEDLQKKEREYQKASRNVDNLYNRSNALECTCYVAGDAPDINSQVERISKELRMENQFLKSELQDMKLELKHCLEKIEGPMKIKLEAEKQKCEYLQSELKHASKNMLLNQGAFTSEMNQLKLQLCCACNNITDLNHMNQRLKDEMTTLDCMCQKLEDDLIKQKLSEAETIKRLTERRKVEGAMIQSSEEFKCESNLDVIARKLSKTLKDIGPCDECSKLPAELTSAAKCIRDLSDMVRSHKPISSKVKSKLTKPPSEVCCSCCRSIVDIEQDDGVWKTKTTPDKIMRTIHPLPESENEPDKSLKIEESFYSAKDAPCSKMGFPCSKIPSTVTPDVRTREEIREQPHEPKDKHVQVKMTEDKACRAPCSGILAPVKDAQAQKDLSALAEDSTIEPAKVPSTTSSDMRHIEQVTHSILDKIPDDVIEKPIIEVEDKEVEEKVEEIIEEGGEGDVEKVEVGDEELTSETDALKILPSPVPTTDGLPEKPEITDVEKTLPSTPTTDTGSKEGWVGKKIPIEEERGGDFPYVVEGSAYEVMETPDLHLTTTVTDSGTLEVITEGPTGTIETTLTYTDSGNIEVVTQMTHPDLDKTYDATLEKFASHPSEARQISIEKDESFTVGTIPELQKGADSTLTHPGEEKASAAALEKFASHPSQAVGHPVAKDGTTPIVKIAPGSIEQTALSDESEESPDLTSGLYSASLGLKTESGRMPDLTSGFEPSSMVKPSGDLKQRQADVKGSSIPGVVSFTKDTDDVPGEYQGYTVSAILPKPSSDIKQGSRHGGELPTSVDTESSSKGLIGKAADIQTRSGAIGGRSPIISTEQQEMMDGQGDPMRLVTSAAKERPDKLSDDGRTPSEGFTSTAGDIKSSDVYTPEEMLSDFEESKHGVVPLLPSGTLVDEESAGAPRSVHGKDITQAGLLGSAEIKLEPGADVPGAYLSASGEQVRPSESKKSDIVPKSKIFDIPTSAGDLPQAISFTPDGEVFPGSSSEKVTKISDLSGPIQQQRLSGAAIVEVKSAGAQKSSSIHKEAGDDRIDVMTSVGKRSDTQQRGELPTGGKVPADFAATHDCTCQSKTQTNQSCQCCECKTVGVTTSGDKETITDSIQAMGKAPLDDIKTDDDSEFVTISEASDHESDHVGKTASKATHDKGDDAGIIGQQASGVGPVSSRGTYEKDGDVEGLEKQASGVGPVSSRGTYEKDRDVEGLEKQASGVGPVSSRGTYEKGGDDEGLKKQASGVGPVSSRGTYEKGREDEEMQEQASGVGPVSSGGTYEKGRDAEGMEMPDHLERRTDDWPATMEDLETRFPEIRGKSPSEQQRILNEKGIIPPVFADIHRRSAGSRIKDPVARDSAGVGEQDADDQTGEVPTRYSSDPTKTQSNIKGILSTGKKQFEKEILDLGPQPKGRSSRETEVMRLKSKTSPTSMDELFEDLTPEARSKYDNLMISGKPDNISLDAFLLSRHPELKHKPKESRKRLLQSLGYLPATSETEEEDEQASEITDYTDEKVVRAYTLGGMKPSKTPLDESKQDSVDAIVADIVEAAARSVSGRPSSKITESKYFTPQPSTRDASLICKASCSTKSIQDVSGRVSKEASVSCKAPCRSAATIHADNLRQSDMIDEAIGDVSTSQPVSVQRTPSQRDDSVSCRSSCRDICVQNTGTKDVASQREIREIVTARSDSTTTSSSEMQKSESKDYKKGPTEVPPSKQPAKKSKISRKRRLKLPDCMKCLCNDPCGCEFCLPDQEKKSLKRGVKSCECPPHDLLLEQMMRMSRSAPTTTHAPNCRCNACTAGYMCGRRGQPPVESPSEDSDNQPKKHPPGCECVDCICMPTIKKLANTREFPIIHDSKQIYQVKVKCGGCANAENARRNLEMRSRIPISTNTTSPPKVRPVDSRVANETSSQPKPETTSSAHITPSALQPQVTGVDSVYGSIACDCPQCACNECPDEKKQAKKPKPIRADADCCCNKDPCICDSCIVAELTKKLKEAEEKLAAVQSMAAVPVGDQHVGPHDAKKGPSADEDDEECNCVECVCPQSDKMPKKGSSPGGDVSHPDDCDCAQCNCPAKDNMPKGAPSSTKPDDHPPDCTCDHCECPGLHDYHKGDAGPVSSGPSRPGDHPPDCTCDHCQCPGLQDFHKGDAGPVSSGPFPKIGDVTCDCIECKCSPCADPKKHKAIPLGPDGPAGPVAHKGPADCDCPECRCNPCADPKRKKEDQCDCPICKCIENAGLSLPPLKDDHQEECDCPQCACPDAEDFMGETLKKIDHPEGCTCDTCMCFEEIMQTDKFEEKDKGIQPSTESGTHAAECTCDECKCPPIDEGGDKVDCSCIKCECEVCTDSSKPRLHGGKPEDGLGECMCAQCICKDCYDKKKGQDGSGLGAEPGSGHGAGCSCTVCLCQDCGNRTKPDHGDSCKCQECLCKNCEKKAGAGLEGSGPTDHPSGCTCFECVCKECYMKLAPLKHDEGCQCISCVCVECLKKLQQDHQQTETHEQKHETKTADAAVDRTVGGIGCDCEHCLCIDCKGLGKGDPGHQAQQAKQQGTVQGTSGEGQHGVECFCAECRCEPCSAKTEKKSEGPSHGTSGEQKHSGDCSCAECKCKPCFAKKSTEDVCNCDVCACLECTRKRSTVAKKTDAKGDKHDDDCTCADCKCKPCFAKKSAQEDCNCDVCECLECTKKKSGVAKKGVQREKHAHEPGCTCDICECTEEPLEVHKSEHKVAEHKSEAKLLDPPPFEVPRRADCDCKPCSCIICRNNAARTDGGTQYPDDHPAPPFEIPVRIACVCNRCSCIFCLKEAPLQKSVAAQPSLGTAVKDHGKGCLCDVCTCTSAQVQPKVQAESHYQMAQTHSHPTNCNCPVCQCLPCSFKNAAATKSGSKPVEIKKSVPVEVIKAAPGIQMQIERPKHCDCPTCTCDEGEIRTTTLDKPSVPATSTGYSTTTTGATTAGPTSATHSQFLSAETLELSKPDVFKMYPYHPPDCDCAQCKCVPCADTKKKGGKIAAHNVDSQIKSMGNVALVKSIQAANKENCACRSQIEEIKRTLEKIKCACSEAEYRSSKSLQVGKESSHKGRPFVKQASPFGQTMSGLKMALNNLQAKCQAKDKMIEAMTTELAQRGSPQAFDNVMKASCMIPMALDYDHSEDVKLPSRSKMQTNVIRAPTELRDASTAPCDLRCVASKGVEVRTHKHKKKREKGSENRSLDCSCSKPHLLQRDDKSCMKFSLGGFEVVDIKRITDDSLIVKWNAPQNTEVQGYDIFVNGNLATKVMSGARTSAMMHSLDLTRSVQITIYAVTRCGRVEPPAIAIYEIKGGSAGNLAANRSCPC